MKNKNRRPNLYIIAGPNGAGKTTFARKFLPQYVECLEFVNADFIAGGLSPFAPERAAIFDNSGDVPKMIGFEESGKIEILDPAL
ncbi:MAG: hypothetical protein QME90_19825, partial [Thermodesulfobacteriota bacterium]|nr:hypothetical protein [Thermodesulfobacteriota bacterium]